MVIVLSVLLTGCDLTTFLNQMDNQRASLQTNRMHGAGKITRLEVHKGARRLDAFSSNRKIRSFDVNLGFSPLGHKFQEFDGKTPVGRYVINRKNPNSQFFLSLGLSYPNVTDIRLAEARGVDPGGDIFIHGQPNNAKGRRRAGDWTEGCIAVTNEEMAVLFRAVEVGTPVYIYH